MSNYKTSASARSAARRFTPVLLATALLGGLPILAGCDRADTVQRSYRGMAMEQLYDPKAVEALIPVNAIPEPEYRDPFDPEAPALSEVMQNVQVLNDLTLLEFTRLMQAMSTWVAPEQGCEYCHNPENLASDEKYTKVVARRMLEMTRQINTEWKDHVKGTGVTCWTCHRGENVPSGIWFKQPGPRTADITLAGRGGQNTPGIRNVGYASLPYDPLTAFLSQDNSVSVQGLDPLAGTNRHSIKQAEWTYSLMMYISNSLGVNCTYCHVTRAMGRWEQSTPQRVTAWYGIRMVRNLNNAYLDPLKPVFPDYRLGPTGDGPKVGCETCHKGVFKPLYGVSMLGDYPELAGVVTERPAPWDILEEEEEPPEEPTAQTAPTQTAPAEGPQSASAR
jgi:photosynthetic reaction center cytochrome c subunit